MAKSVRRGEVWFVEFGNGYSDINLKGYRPCVIVSNDILGVGGTLATVIPLTSQDKSDGNLHVTIEKSNMNNLKDTSTSLVENIICVPMEKIRFCVGKVSDEEIKKINHSIIFALGLEECYK